MRKIILAAAVAAAAMAAAGCSSAGTSGTSAGTGSPPPSGTHTPSAWHAWGTYTGPWPPVGEPLPGPITRFNLATYQGIKGQIVIGVPLHGNIPREAFDCGLLGDPSSQDLNPGQYVVPFAYVATNRTGGHIGALTPQIWTELHGDPNAYGTQITGQAGSSLWWQDGTCTAFVLGPYGREAAYGLIGPFTKVQLNGLHLFAAWGIDPDPTYAVLTQALAPWVYLNVREAR